MFKHAIIVKTSRIVAISTLIGTSAALMLVGAPADASTIHSSTGSLYDAAARGIALLGRGI